MANMAWLNQCEGIYYVGWRDANGRSRARSLGTRNKRVAEAAKRKFLRELPEEKPGRPPPPKTVRVAIDLYLAGALARVRRSTHTAVRSRLQPGLGLFGNRELGSIEAYEFETYRDRRLARHKDIGTTFNVYAHAQQPRLRQAISRLNVAKSFPPDKPAAYAQLESDGRPQSP